MKAKIKRFFPVGYNVKAEMKAILLVYFLPLIVFFIEFFSQFCSGYYSLFTYGSDPKTIRPSATMPYYHTMVNHTGKLFAPAVLLFLCIIVLHYRYHYEGSKSIYLMKRLPDKKEIHIRCLTASVAGLVITYLTMLVIIFLTYRFYMAFTPPQCLPEDILGGLKGNIIWLIKSEFDGFAKVY